MNAVRRGDIELHHRAVDRGGFRDEGGGDQAENLLQHAGDAQMLNGGGDFQFRASRDQSGDEVVADILPSGTLPDMLQLALHHVMISLTEGSDRARALSRRSFDADAAG